MESKIKLGKYKHFKGTFYQVTDLAKHTETLEDMVIYHSLDQSEKIWVRPLVMFLENVETESYKGPRFEYIRE